MDQFNMHCVEISGTPRQRGHISWGRIPPTKSSQFSRLGVRV